MNTRPYLKFPAPDATRSGNKVCWKYYKDEAVAKEAAKVAEYNAVVAEKEGYDFGFCNPGTIEQMTTGDYAGMYEVCCP